VRNVPLLRASLYAALSLVAAQACLGCGGSASYAPVSQSGGAYYGDAEMAESDDAMAPSAPPMPMEPMDAPVTTASLERAGYAPSPAPMRSAPNAKSASPQGAPAATTAAPGSTAPTSQQGAGEDSKRSPILIYRAEFTMSVFDVQKSLEGVAALASQHGGYLARRDDRSITVRVPASRFDEVVTALGALGDVLHRNVVSEDVTAEFRDLEVQLTNLLAMRARFEKLLEKAQKVEEALEIERELGRVTSEIERIKGRLKLLSDLASYSTITVSFQPRSSQAVQDGPFILPLPWLEQLGLPRLLRL
jgi:hypothetical protein